MRHHRSPYRLSHCAASLSVGHRTLIMGVLNVTPDSFSDGGLYFSHGKAIDHALALVEAGADIIDIGGESSRPAGPYGKGAAPVSLREELDRTLPIIEAIARQSDIPISIDTTKAEEVSPTVAIPDWIEQHPLSQPIAHVSYNLHLTF